MNDLTILVNTSDNFEDCWSPFFTLWKKYWPNCPYAIVLNTEHKEFSFAGVPLKCARVAGDESRRLTWSECLARCLDAIDTPYVLYLQEDFFLEGPVNQQAIERFVGVMRRGLADVIRLMECGGSGPWAPTSDPELWAVHQSARYRIALQAALWRRDVLRGHLRMHESPWQLEVFGSARARRRHRERVLCVNRDRYHGPGREIVPYTPTGVVKGQWDRRVVVDLFSRHGIEMDFSQRGFYDPAASSLSTRPLIRRLTDRLRSLV
jgi:hypothetical protein